MNTHSARLHALSAALCALLLLVALGLMDANRAPWWALLATQGALLVVTASAGIWLDRAYGERREAGGERTPPRLPWWAQGDATPQDGWRPEMWQRHGLPGVLRAMDEDAVFWQERMGKQKEEEER